MQKRNSKKSLQEQVEFYFFARKANTNLQKKMMQIQNIQKIIIKWSEINVVEGDISRFNHKHSHLNAK